MKLILGTAQFGLDYGVANYDGKVPLSEVRTILHLADRHGINMLDTAAAYGNSEEVLGTVGVTHFHVISKVPPMPEEISSPSTWATQVVEQSLSKLKLPKLYTLLFHRPLELIGPSGDALLKAVHKMKEASMIERFGISIYSPEELDQVTPYFNPDVVQAPLNIFDRRLITSGWLQALANKGVEVHARSVFLQGLLLMDANERPPYFDLWEKELHRYDSWLSERQISALEGCFGYLNGLDNISRIVVGVNTAAQLEQVIDSMAIGTIEAPQNLTIKDEALINPSKWNL